MSTFYNPYQFIKVKGFINGESSAKTSYQLIEEGKSHVRHDGWQKDTLSGEITCLLTTKSPLFIGAHNNNQSSETQAKDIPHYERQVNGNKQPAIPANSLRGMIGQTLETLSQSTLRVLEDKILSVRKAMPKQGTSQEDNELLYGVGLIHKKTSYSSEATSENASGFSLLPLCVSTQLEMGEDDKGVTCHSDYPWLTLFKGRKLAHCLPAYIDSYSDDNRRIDRLYTLDPSAYPYPANDTFYYAKLYECLNHVTVGEDFNWSTEMLNKDVISKIGERLLAQGHQGILKAKEYEDLAPLEKPKYTRGIIRILDMDNYKKAVPATKKREWFIPYPEEIEKTADLLSIPQAVIDTYTELVAESKKRGKDQNLPVTLRGYGNAGVAENRIFFFGCDFEEVHEEKIEDPEPVKEDKPLSLQQMIAKSLEKNEKTKTSAEKPRIYSVSEISIAALWRKRLPKSTYSYFPAKDNHLTPWRDEEQRDRPRKLTPAESLLGFVSDGTVDGSKTASALASRIKFTDGLLSTNDVNPYDPKSYILKILDSPKTPSPSMYFHDRDNPKNYVNKTALNPEKHKANGYKYYLHHPKCVQGSSDPPSWETRQQNKRLKQKVNVRPVMSGTTFSFSLLFDNLKDEELDLLLTALSPGDDCFHHFGMGKPLGLGSVKLDIAGVFFVDRVNRYKTAQLFSPRFHKAWLQASEDSSLQKQISVANDERLKVTSEHEELKSALVNLRKSIENQTSLVDQETLTDLQSLMNPNAVSAEEIIYYPLAEGQKIEDEDEGFQWFVNNERAQIEDKQVLGCFSGNVKSLMRNTGKKHGKK